MTNMVPPMNDPQLSEKTSSLSTAQLPPACWTYGDYIATLDKAGIKIMLATPLEVDVWLALAATKGWAEMVKTK
ncbi:hypothetical protein IAR50_007481 [Cryptococcus sp. DSM 104548]